MYSIPGKNFFDFVRIDMVPRPLSFLKEGAPERHRGCRYCEKKSVSAHPETEKKRTAYGIPVGGTILYL
ncbi:MAG: hypothetical protein WCR04_11645 [Fibrobacteraceae bacterium]